MEIPLTKGYENPSVQIEDTTIEPVRLYMQDKPYSERAVTLFLELNITQNDKQYLTSLHYWEINTSEWEKNYPKAFGTNLFGLEINNTGNNTEVSLTVENNDFGKPFFLDLKQETLLDDLTIRFNESITEWVAYSSGTSYYNMGSAWIILSRHGEEETIYFDTDTLFAEKELSFEWKDYRLWVLSFYETSVELKVEKK